MMLKRPIIAISVGDPAGIGPEIAVKALSEPDIYDLCRPLLVADVRNLEQIINICQLNLKVHRIQQPAEGKFQYGTIDVIDLENIDVAVFQFNKIAANTGKASFEYVRKVIALAMDKLVDATVTGPIHKESIHLAGFKYAGHTEIFAEFTGTQNFAMMLAEKNFRVVHISTHVSLREAINRVKAARVLEVIKLADQGLKMMGIVSPKIAVAGLNPHAGEGGLFGREEIEEIIPAIEKAKESGINVTGPYPPDTLFPKMQGGQFDIIVCMYHDQGHIPTKLLGFEYHHESQSWDHMSGVNITLGLPIIRVSVDHGVAFDKGGLGIANPESMLQAIRYASQFCHWREK